MMSLTFANLHQDISGFESSVDTDQLASEKLTEFKTHTVCHSACNCSRSGVPYDLQGFS